MTSSFSAWTDSTRSPSRTVVPPHATEPCSVEDTTYVGTARIRSAHSPGRSAHRSMNLVRAAPDQPAFEIYIDTSHGERVAAGLDVIAGAGR